MPRNPVVGYLLFACSTASVSAQDRAVEQRFRVIESGSLPIIQSAPHGGRMRELGGQFRSPKNQVQTAADIAEAVAVHAKEYLTAAKRSPIPRR